MKLIFRSLLAVIGVLVIFIGITSLILWQTKDLGVYSTKDGHLIILRQSDFEALQGAPDKDLIDKSIASIAKAGYALERLKEPKALIAFVYAPASLIIAYQLSRLARHYGYRPYRIRHS